jgi:type IV pilus assembly protein PilM
MARKVNHVWGIEIGQSAIKALRCHLEGGQVVADTFDFVEYPKILSQPDSEPEVLLADALEQFTSRNDLKGSKVAISVPGQQGLAKFFKPPPVEVKRIPDIVRFEAKQQIPFDLNDVIWDFQQMAGANIEDGYALESEVALFAMKREAVYRAIKPFQSSGVEPDIIQLSPVAIYNMIAFDKFSDRLRDETFDPEKPPKSVLLLSIGTDATDLIVTNGFRVWQRTMPIGGNHFTRQLSKELKLTFAKAEHLKRNAMQADDPKLVFQAMRPVFNDMHTEIQRSIGYFRQINKKAELESILLLGNTAKLPGLQAYLSKSLGMDVEVINKYDRLSGIDVVGAPSFKENQPSFGVVYGLCLQGLQQGPIHTNLLPKEIVVDRLIASKKPWMAAAAATLLVSMAVNYGMVYNAYSKVEPELWQGAQSQVTSMKRDSDGFFETDEKQKAMVKLLRSIGEEVSANTDRRKLWLELISVISSVLNRDPQQVGKSPADLPYKDRTDFQITEIDSQFMADISTYLNQPFKDRYQNETRTRLQLVGQPAAQPAADGTTPTSTEPEWITGPAWVVKLEGYHYHNGIPGDEKSDFVRKHLINELENGVVTLPGPDGKLIPFSMKEMGICYPVLYEEVKTEEENIGNPQYELASGGRSTSAAPVPGNTQKQEEYKDENGVVIPPFFKATKATFTVQFVWRERTLAQRMAWKADERFKPDMIPPADAGARPAPAQTDAPAVPAS